MLSNKDRSGRNLYKNNNINIFTDALLKVIDGGVLNDTFTNLQQLLHTPQLAY